MIEFFMPNKVRFVSAMTSSAVVMVATHFVFCQSASAQGLLNRIRTRVEARMLLPPPPAVLPANPYGYRPPVAVPYSNQARLPQRPRVLATPSTQRYEPLGPSIAPRADANNFAEPTFGVEVAPVGFGPSRGLEVRGFRPDSPLPDAGIRPGDVIVAIDGRRTDSTAAMVAARRGIFPGDSPTMQIVRDGQLYQVRLPSWPGDDRAGRQAGAVAATDPNGNRLGAEPRFAAKPPLPSVPLDNASSDDPSIMRSPIEASGSSVAQRENPESPDLPVGPTPARPRASLGISARDASPQRGVVVVNVNDGSAGQIAGIEINDRIVSAAGRLIRDTGALIRELSLRKPGDSVTLGIARGDAMRDVVVEMGGPDGVIARPSVDVADSAATPAKATDDPPAGDDPSSSGSSLFSGVGSALGNFFGGNSAQQMPSAAGTDVETESVPTTEVQTEEPADQVYELPAPAAEPDTESSDPLALPEDE